MIAAFNLNAIAQTSSIQIVDCLVEGTLIAMLAGLVSRMARRQNSGTRFALWFAALMAIAVVPFLSQTLWLQAAGISAATLSRPAITLPVFWALYLFAAWAAIAGWSLLGVGRGLWHLHVLRNSCVPVDTTVLDARLQETLEHSRSTKAAVLCTSAMVQVPTAIGLVRPAVVIPEWVMQELSPNELHQILLHELAHLRRYDDWTNLAQKVVKALFFFHPAVWWIEKQVSLEREMACDDAVVAETEGPRAYAECLAHLAEKTLIQRSVALAQAALGRLRHTSLRVAQLLDANRPATTGRSWKPAVSLLAAFAVASVVVVSRAPRLIGFEDGAPIGRSTIAASSPRRASGRVATVPAAVVQASLHSDRTPRSTENSPRAAATPPASDRRPYYMIRQAPAGVANVHDSNVHLSAANTTPLAFTETLFVVIEGSDHGSPDNPVFQIQLWRVMVLHPVVDPSSNRIPPKRT
jgi:Zn-dependent protease with chaperone function